LKGNSKECKRKRRLAQPVEAEPSVMRREVKSVFIEEFRLEMERIVLSLGCPL
jgi:hypothetical protein